MKTTQMALLLALGVTALAPAAAQGKPATKLSGAQCPSFSSSAALSAFGDTRSYFPAPGGNFENAATGWTLTGGAGVVPGTGPLHAGSDKSAMRLPSGSSATSPAFCVDLTAPSFRFFAAQLDASFGKGLTVDMIYADATRDIVASAKLKKGSVTWTLVKDVALPTAPLRQVGGMRQVQLRFGATSGDWRVDDVLIDPRMRS